MMAGSRRGNGRTLANISEDQKHKCPYDGCSRFFAQKSGLENHIRTHTGERPFKCPYEGCNKSFTQKGGLTSHIRSHTGARPFKCQYCSWSFRQSSTLYKHIRTQHPGANLPDHVRINDEANRYTRNVSLVRNSKKPFRRQSAPAAQVSNMFCPVVPSARLFGGSSLLNLSTTEDDGSEMANRKRRVSLQILEGAKSITPPVRAELPIVESDIPYSSEGIKSTLLRRESLNKENLNGTKPTKVKGITFGLFERKYRQLLMTSNAAMKMMPIRSNCNQPSTNGANSFRPWL